MAHNTSKPAKFLDFINREGFEWLMHPINNYRFYQSKYRGQYAGLRFSTRFFFTALFTLLPVIPAAYVVSRNVTLFSELRTNPIKTFFMAAVVGAASAGLQIFGFNAIVNTMSTWVPSFMSFMPAIVPAPFIVGGLLIIAGATLLYGAKLAAQAINSFRFGGQTSTSKHQLPVSKVETDNIPGMQGVYNEVLNKHREMKALLVRGPSVPVAESGNFFGEEHGFFRADDAHISFVEEAVESGKVLLNGLEVAMKDSIKGNLNTDQYNGLFGNNYASGSIAGTGLYNQYKTSVGSATRADDFTVGKVTDFGVADEHVNGIGLDTLNHKLMSNNFN